MDPCNPSIMGGTGRIRVINNICYIEITTKVQASMKDDTYLNTTCFSMHGLMYCKCNCKAGSYRTEKVMCVHTPAVGVLFSHLLLDGLAEHVLVNLAVRWGNKDNNLETNDQKHDLRKNIEIAINRKHR